MPDRWDDEQLFTALKESLRAHQAVPREFFESGKNAYAWHDIDAELAQLTYDSTLDQQATLGMRSETGSIRALNFTSAHLTIELEVNEGSLLGEIIPVQAGTIEIQTYAGTTATTPVDDLGYFPIQPTPATPFRLHCHTADGTDVLTGWITL